jgi:chaperonin cofactor prefoldin
MTRTKGITIWEQYVEFGVLGLACVLFIFFVSSQFIGQQNVATVQGHGDVRPGEINALLEDEARRIGARLGSDAAAPAEIPPPDPLADEFLARLQRSARPEAAVTPAFAFVPLDTAERIPPEAIFVEAELPTPESVVSRQYYDALNEETVETYEELRNRFDAPPYDITWTTVASIFNIGKVMQQFRQGDPENDAEPIPQRWHNDRVEIVNVIVEREEYVNGHWTNRTELSPMPGQLHLRDQLAGEIDSAQRDLILRQIRTPEQQRSLYQPNFFTTRNESWQPPDPLVDDLDEAADDEHRIRRLQRQIARARAQREELQGELDTLPDGDAVPGGGDRGPGGGRAPGGGGSPAGGGGRAPGAGGAPPTPGGGEPTTGPGGQRDPQRTENVRANLERRISRLNVQIDRAEEELRALRPEMDVEAVEADLLELDEVTIWMHDMDIVPGYQYRYRMAVEIYNPFYARSLHLVPEQEHLADSFQMRSEFSDWSDPISIRPPVHVFITRAYPAGHDRLGGGAMGPTLGEATVDVFRFHDGRWWENRFTVEPGQRVGGRREAGRRGEEGPMIDYGTDWFVLDILPDLTASSDDMARGRGAVVVLQHLRYGDIMEVRHPQEDADSELRRRLRSEVQVVIRD